MADCEREVNDASVSAAVAPKTLITEDIVQEALSADKGATARLVAWRVVDFTKPGDNFVSVVSSVEVKYEIDGQSSEVVYVVKLNPCSSSPMNEIVNTVCFETEAKFYLNLVPELNGMLNEIGQRELQFPKCLSANLEKGKEVIFMEDLRKRGYKMRDSKLGMDEAHSTLALRELARLHAASLLLQNKYPGEDLSEKYPYMKWGMPYLVAKSDEFCAVFKNSTNFAKELLQKVGGYERAVAWIDTLVPRLADIFDEQLQYGEPKVVCHGDYWNNNLLFKYDEAGHPEDVMLVDLQLSYYGPPTPDLNCLLYSSTTRDVREASLQAFLDCYRECLTEIMEAAGQEAPFTREQLLKDFRATNLYGVIIGMMVVPIMVIESDDAVDASKDGHLYVEEMMANARARAMAQLDTNPLLKPRLLALFDDMMEVGLIP